MTAWLGASQTTGDLAPERTMTPTILNELATNPTVRARYLRAGEVSPMSYRVCRMSDRLGDQGGRAQKPARRHGLTLAALVLTAALPGSVIAGAAPTDTATVTIRVSVAPNYRLSRASVRVADDQDTAAGLCLGTNADRPSLPVRGAWSGRDGSASDFVLPSCDDPPSQASFRQLIEASPSGVSFLFVSPE